MERIHIGVMDKRATNKSPGTKAVCGNKDYVICFEFDREWDTYHTKTARFITKKGYTDVIFEGEECPMPMLQDVTWCEIGVYAGDLQTTTPALVSMEKSILCGKGQQHPNPPVDIYNQLMEKMNELPSPSKEDDGKVLGVSNGEYVLQEASGAPGSVSYATDDEILALLGEEIV